MPREVIGFVLEAPGEVALSLDDERPAVLVEPADDGAIGTGTAIMAPGTDRQPSASSTSRRLPGSGRSSTGLMMWPTCRTPLSSGQSYTNSLRPTPT